jgi:hypothetical protein
MGTGTGCDRNVNARSRVSSFWQMKEEDVASGIDHYVDHADNTTTLTLSLSLRGRGQQTRERLRVRVSFLVSFFLLCFSQTASALTVAELTKAPSAFDQKPVTVVGEVANVVTRYGDKPYTTFDLLDAEDKPLPIFIWGKPTFKQGEVCRVTGKFAVEKHLETHVLAGGVEAEKVEKLSTAESETESVIFRKKKKTGLHGPRGFYIPQ